jgi:HEPN domain-containing protein
MPEAESQPPADWFAQGDMDIQAADILLAQDGPLPVVAFHVQQAVEKYLKGLFDFYGLAPAAHPRCRDPRAGSDCP